MNNQKICCLFELRDDLASIIHTITHYNEALDSSNIPHRFIIFMTPQIRENIGRLINLQKKIKNLHLEGRYKSLNQEILNLYSKVGLWAYLPIEGTLHTSILKEYYFNRESYDYLWSRPEKKSPHSKDQTLWKRLNLFLKKPTTNDHFVCKIYKRKIVEHYYQNHQGIFPTNKHFESFHFLKKDYLPIEHTLSYYQY